MPSYDLGFKFNIGQQVTRTRNAQALQHIDARRYTVVSQLFETGPDGPKRFYYLRDTEKDPTDAPMRATEAPLVQLVGDDF